ncbi:MAG: HPF/RaiA family ribosome-associated protein [Candidatus Pacebacteria bacterium]|jgi:ribosomal subunit interface protein|nr:HPF/RaiA family ribosome-associated protein [Candidatus Paceibacterota bacterium]
MTFPTITFTHKNVSPDHTLHALVTSKLTSLQKYLKGARSVRCEVEFERITSHTQGSVCRIEVNLWRGDRLARAEATEETFEKAVDEVRRNLEHELERAHDKRVSMFRKGARRIKEMMRWGK